MNLKRIFASVLCLILTLNMIAPISAHAATEWPSNVTLEGECGIVIDANTGAVLFGQNIHTRYYPASITKILTALVILENCNLDDELTFSHRAVYDVDSGSTNAGYDEGDTITVGTALYAMLIKSANEVANALAEHCSGSIEAFSVLMNKKASELGCTESNFSNPSGLSDEEHYTTAYDFSLIAKAAYSNPDFVTINSTSYYALPPSLKNPDGLTVYCGHKMLKKNSSYYYDGIIGGKTGYTLLAGNTLVTCAERNGLKLISVVLNAHQTHYIDTKSMLDFAFDNFEDVKLPDSDVIYNSIKNDDKLKQYTNSEDSKITIDDTNYVTLPINSDISDIQSTVSDDLVYNHPENAVATINYTYNERYVGSTYILADSPATEVTDAYGNYLNTSSNVSSASNTDSDKQSKAILNPIIKIALIILSALILIIGLIFLIRYIIAKQEEKERIVFRAKRQKRRIDLGLLNPNDDPSIDTSASVNAYTKSSRRRKKRGIFKNLFKR